MRSEVNPRSRLKIWVLLYGCLGTRALCLLPVAGYDTDSFLLRHQEFVARHGNPAVIFSDRGTNLVKAGATLAKEKLDDDRNWDWARIVADNKASNWTFTPIGCQWRNGFVERMVGITKASLALTLPNGKYPTYAEMITVLARIANAINSRPIGISRVGDESSDPQPLTPNMLLLGRSGNDAPAIYDLHETLPQRCLYVKDILNTWWEKWSVKVFPYLLPCKKWQHRSSNLRVGDICQLLYKGALVEDYKLVKVTKVKPDAQGVVRTVKVAYRQRKSREKREVCSTKLVEEEVGVQRLCLLHPWEEDIHGGEETMLPVEGKSALTPSMSASVPSSSSSVPSSLSTVMSSSAPASSSSVPSSAFTEPTSSPAPSSSSPATVDICSRFIIRWDMGIKYRVRKLINI